MAMARRAGALGVLVLSGETSREMLATATEMPDLVFDHLGALTAALRSAVLAAARAPGPEAR
jgi:phosphoglycolate phosphatase-like HAD superfamily hydrolase